jgi:hypothetical protein
VTTALAVEQERRRRPRREPPPPRDVDRDAPRGDRWREREGPPPEHKSPMRPEGRRGDRRPFFNEMRGERLERVLGFLEEHFPERHEQLLQLQESDPDGFSRRLRRMMPRIMRMIEAVERSPDVGKMTVEVEQLAFEIHNRVEQYFDAIGSERQETLRREIHKLAARQFDIRQELREIEITRMERRLDAVRAQLRRNEEHREERIERVLEELGVID